MRAVPESVQSLNWGCQEKSEIVGLEIFNQAVIKQAWSPSRTPGEGDERGSDLLKLAHSGGWTGNITFNEINFCLGLTLCHEPTL